MVLKLSTCIKLECLLYVIKTGWTDIKWIETAKELENNTDVDKMSVTQLPNSESCIKLNTGCIYFLHTYSCSTGTKWIQTATRKEEMNKSG